METLNDYLPTTPDLNAERLDALRKLWPDLFTNEGKPNPTAVQAALGLGTPAAERYAFTWSGKTAARQQAFAPTTYTLVPDAARSFQPEKGRHVLIEGENLHVLKLLLAGYRERVKCIYIDPPYNTGKDFVYSDNYTEDKQFYLEQTGGIQDGVRADTNPDTNGRYHSDWLSMMYSRLLLARQLLREDGVVFVSIDDNEAHNLRKVLDDVFGEENFVGQVIWQRSKKGDSKLIAKTHEYLLVFAKDKNELVSREVWKVKKPGADAVLAHYDYLRDKFPDQHDTIRYMMRLWYKSSPGKEVGTPHKHYSFSDNRGLYFPDNFHGPDDGRTSRPRHDIIHPNGKVTEKPSTGWRWDEKRTNAALAENPPRIHFGPDETTIPNRKTYLFEVMGEPFASVFYRDGRAATLELEQILGKGLFDFPKDKNTLGSLIQLATDSDKKAIVLDFFAGSGTTFQAVAELNISDGGTRQCILVQLPEKTTEGAAAHTAGYRKISDLTIERAKRVVSGYGDTPQPLETGFRVWRLESSRFPAATFQPKPDQSADEQLAELKKYLAAKQATLQLPFADNDQPARIAEILLKNGFSLNYTLSEPLPEYAANRIVRVTDQETSATALLSLDDTLTDATVQQLSHQPPAERFIAPERAFNTTAKWNLKMHLKDNLLAT